jgi:hypothetical protein
VGLHLHVATHPAHAARFRINHFAGLKLYGHNLKSRTIDSVADTSLSTLKLALHMFDCRIESRQAARICIAPAYQDRLATMSAKPVALRQRCTTLWTVHG